jgi:hypothetical protein
MTILITYCLIAGVIGWHIGYWLGWLIDPKHTLVAVARAIVAMDNYDREFTTTLYLLAQRSKA